MTNLDISGLLITVHPDRRVEEQVLFIPAEIETALLGALGGPGTPVASMEDVVLPDHLRSLLSPHAAALMDQARGAAAFTLRDTAGQDENFHATALVRASIERSVDRARAEAPVDENFAVEPPLVLGPMAIITGTDDFLALL